MSYSKNGRLLLCAPSNAAVDELLQRLLQGLPDSESHNGSRPTIKRHRCRMLRLGSPPENASSEIVELSLEHQTEQQVLSSVEYRHYEANNQNIASALTKIQKLKRGRSYFNLLNFSDNRRIIP
jgi:superfamily I DNA and/or RNA helicase